MRLFLVTLVVDDYDRAIDFYCGKLGFELVEDTRLSAAKRWVVVSPGTGGANLLLARAAKDSQVAAIGRQAGGRVGFFLETGDFAREHTRLSQAGVEFIRPPRNEPYGRVAVFRDLYGNDWDLIEPAAS